jgi:hypothetical protein
MNNFEMRSRRSEQASGNSREKTTRAKQADEMI